ncbi:MAG: glycosyltransferase involved in cell wall biosynthesis [Sphingobacteriales bacterium]|jgi:glycosyltransferase involved in cell wall biosynthesis
MKLFFWLDFLNPHLVPFINNLPLIDKKLEVTIIAPKEFEEKRRRLGLVPGDTSNVSVIIPPLKNDWDKIFTKKNSEETFHFFYGLRARIIRKGLTKALMSGHYTGVFSEVPELFGIRALTRRIASYVIERPFRNKLDYVFTIGREGYKWFQFCGYSNDKLIPFYYSIEPINNEVSSNSREKAMNPHLNIVFAGRLIPLKALDLLFYSLAKVKRLRGTFNLDIYGLGPEQASLEALAKRLAIEKNITFKGVLENQKLRQNFINYDLLILPSYKDGWGVVINEALHAGTPVICSSVCGGSQLIRPGFNGKVFEKGDVDGLCDQIMSQIEKGPISLKKRQEIIKDASNLFPKLTAEYFLYQLELKKPIN